MGLVCCSCCVFILRESDFATALKKSPQKDVTGSWAMVTRRRCCHPSLQQERA